MIWPLTKVRRLNTIAATAVPIERTTTIRL
jgi:hypothetical protein